MALSRLRVESILLAILALQCSAALCANRSGAIYISTNAVLQMVIGFAVGAQAFNTSMILMATKKRT